MLIKPSIYLLSLTSLLHTGMAIAEENVFTCTTENNKSIVLSNNNGVVTYALKNGEITEITLRDNTTDYNTSFGEAIDGVNRYDTISFIKNDYRYLILAISDEFSTMPKRFSGVVVYKKNNNSITKEREVSRLTCKQDTVKNNFYLIYKYTNK